MTYYASASWPRGLEALFDEPKCGLCQFELRENEELVACYHGEWREVDETLINEYPVDTGIGCHTECFRMTSLKNPQRLFEATRQAFPLSITENARRFEWHLSSIVSIMSQGIVLSKTQATTPPPPCEILSLIAQELVRCHAVAEARRQWKPPVPCRLSLRKDVWVRRTSFEGRNYVSSLSNDADDADDTDSSRSKRIISPDNNIGHFFTMEDHAGILDIFVEKDLLEKPGAASVTGIWWRRFSVSNIDTVITGESDGIKLRKLIMENQCPIAWSVPLKDDPQLHFLPHRDQQKPIYMASLLCNDPLITGYSALWEGTLMAIHAHKSEKSIDFEPEREATWIFLPIDGDETITHIFEGRGQTKTHVALGIITNKNRHLVLGSYLQHVTRSWKLIHQPSQTPSYIFYECSKSGLGALAFEAQHRPEETQDFHPAGPNLSYSLWRQEDFFYSTSDLAGLSSITPCGSTDGRTITGLLLHFPNSHRESVGQVRLDALMQNIEIDMKQTVFLVFGQIDKRYPNVVKIVSSYGEVSLDADFIIELQPLGRLEWIWSWRQCHLVYQDQKSPKTI